MGKNTSADVVCGLSLKYILLVSARLGLPPFSPTYLSAFMLFAVATDKQELNIHSSGYAPSSKESGRARKRKTTKKESRRQEIERQKGIETKVIERKEERKEHNEGKRNIWTDLSLNLNEKYSAKSTLRPKTQNQTRKTSSIFSLPIFFSRPGPRCSPVIFMTLRVTVTSLCIIHS